MAKKYTVTLSAPDVPPFTLSGDRPFEEAATEAWIDLVKTMERAEQERAEAEAVRAAKKS